jgi:hypothetical protein
VLELAGDQTAASAALKESTLFYELEGNIGRTVRSSRKHHDRATALTSSAVAANAMLVQRRLARRSPEGRISIRTSLRLISSWRLCRGESGNPTPGARDEARASAAPAARESVVASVLAQLADNRGES